MREQPEVLTLQEVASYLKVAVRTVYALVKDGKLPAFRVGRVLRCRRTDVDDFIDRQARAVGKQLPDAPAEDAARR